MMMKENISNKTAAYNGALVAVAGVFAYSLVVMCYAIIRSSGSIYNIMPSLERSTILWTNGVSIAYSVAVFALLMAFVSFIAGAIGGVILRKSLLWFNPKGHPHQAIFVSCTTALILLTLLYFLFYLLFKERITFKYVETLLFWYIFPAVVFFIATAISGAKLNKQLIAMKRK